MPDSSDSKARHVAAHPGGFLGLVERAGNKLPDPVTIFCGLAVLALLLSFVAAKAKLAVTHPTTGATIAAINLLDRAGLRRVFTEAVTNFTGFAPLGVVLVIMIGIGVAQQTGLFAAFLKLLVLSVPARAITPMVIFAGMMSHMAADAGNIILPPLAAALFVSLGRHPLAGVAAAFAGIAGGFSANLLISAIDPLLGGITQEAAGLLGRPYVVRATANWFFMAVSVPVLTAVGWLVTARFIEPRLGVWTGASGSAPPGAAAPMEAGEFKRLEPHERRGLWAALVSMIAAALLIVPLVWSPAAVLRDETPDPIASWKPFFESLVPLLAIVFFVPGFAYGLVTRGIRSDRDVAKMMSDTMASMGTYIVIAFFAGQFLAYFKWSNLGMIIAIEGAALLTRLRLTETPALLMVAFIILSATINLTMASASAKWAVMAPVFVPMFMLVGWSPELTQGLYRIGDSTSNTITPLNYYIAMFYLPVVQRYMPQAGMGTIIAAMLPYSLAFGVVWSAMMVVWVWLGFPLGPGSPLTYGG